MACVMAETWRLKNFRCNVVWGCVLNDRLWAAMDRLENCYSTAVCWLLKWFIYFKPSEIQWSPYVPHSGHYMYRTVVTICTAQWSLYVPHSGHCMYRTLVTICTAQWSVYVPHSGHYMYQQFNNQQFHVLPTQCIYVFCVDLRTNSHYFPIQH